MNSDNYTNPFDSDEHNFLVLKNNSDQFSLWPEFAAVPAGWRIVFGPDVREACENYVEQNWQAINPFVQTGKREVGA